MSVVDVTTVEEFDKALQENENVVVDFHAPAWCVPCKRLHPHYVGMSERMDGVSFYTVDVDTADPALVESYKVQGVPKVLAFKNGEQIAEVEERTGPKLIKEIDALFKE